MTSHSFNLVGKTLLLIHCITYLQKTAWISHSTALLVFLTAVQAFLTWMGMFMVGTSSLKIVLKFYPVSVSGWGDTGVQETSTDKLQEIVVPIVQSSICIERMSQTVSVDEDLIVCAGGGGAGPCKVSRQRHCHIMKWYHV